MRLATTGSAAGLANMSEAVTYFTGEAWDANKGSAATFFNLAQILESEPMAYYGAADDISTDMIDGMYWARNAMTATFAGELDNYTYVRGQEPFSYRLAYSQNHVGIEFTKEQFIYLGNASGRYYELFETEFNDKIKQMFIRCNRQLLGVGGLGTGTRPPGFNTFDIWGLRTIMNNVNPYYSAARPGTGELNFYNNALPIVIGVGQMFNTLSWIQDQVAANNEARPWLVIAPLASRQVFQAEITVAYAGAGAARPTVLNFDSKNPSYRYSSLDFHEYGVDMTVIFDPEMPGGGAGAVNNEFIFLNPGYLRWRWIPENWFDWDEFEKGGQGQPNVMYSNMYNYWALEVTNPKAHAYTTLVQLPVI